MKTCGAIYDRPDTLGELRSLPDPVQCNLPYGHSGSHSYTDNCGGVSWGTAQCEAVGPITGIRCILAKGHANDHHAVQKTGSGESWYSETCGALFPFGFFGMPEIKGYPESRHTIRCNLPRGHGGDTHAFKLDGLSLYLWPVNPADFDMETDDAMREGMKELARREPNFPSVLEYEAKQRRERRERIALTVMNSLLRAMPWELPAGNPLVETIRKESSSFKYITGLAINYADALIAELDKGEI